MAYELIFPFNRYQIMPVVNVKVLVKFDRHSWFAPKFYFSYVTSLFC